MENSRFFIRDLTEADIEGKARVHHQAWIETYTGLIDGAIIAAHSLEKCLETARKFPDNNLAVLDRADGDRVVGFASIAPDARKFVTVPDASEVGAFYLLKCCHGLGLGRRLMEACLERLPRPNVALYVLKGNDNARGFYEHMGFRLTGYEHITRTRDGGEINELEMVLER